MTTTKPNTAFWIIAVVAILWNIMGIFQYLAPILLPEMVNEAYGTEELAIYNALPSWYQIVFAIAVFSGFLGSLLLIARKKAAKPLFLLSLVAVLVQMGYWLFATDIMELHGIQAAIMPLIVITISIFLYFYSKGALQKGWLR
ncbi:hypothetical protein [Altibacter sp. HG106]|uniref:hypothetical protein n=1 Tax=Altibacter sp. HG106 TaxID=3023937 RepID=UPI00235076A9|nr:hypothetical protein [Altibacter sp. HG106]MDC7993585.1 hypothetical protein [Altibacter sp. HG106]